MINKLHQGEKIYLDNLYLVLKVDDYFDINDEESYFCTNGLWKKPHIFSFEIDKNNLGWINDGNKFREDTNILDNRDVPWKETLSRI